MARTATSVTATRGDLLGTFQEHPLTVTPIGTRILTPIAVGKDSDVFGVMPREASLAAPDVKRSARSGYSRSEFELEESSWKCEDYGHEEPWAIGEANLYRDLFSYEQVLSARGRVIVERKQEMRIAAALHNTTTFPISGTTGHNASNAWSSAANADPQADIAQAIRGVRARSGLTPNLLQISFRAWWDLSRCASILDRLKYTRAPGIRLPLAELAMAVGIEEVVVADLTYNSANEGQTAVVAEVWSPSYAFVGVVARGMDIAQPCIGRTFYNDTDGGLMTVEQYFDQKVRTEYIRARQKVDNKVISSDFGYLIGNVGS